MEEIRNARAVVTGKRTVWIPMPRQSNSNRDYKEPRFRLVCSYAKEANEFV
jgi:hypothetical protein